MKFQISMLQMYAQVVVSWGILLLSLLHVKSCFSGRLILLILLAWFNSCQVSDGHCLNFSLSVSHLGYYLYCTFGNYIFCLLRFMSFKNFYAFCWSKLIMCFIVTRKLCIKRLVSFLKIQECRSYLLNCIKKVSIVHSIISLALGFRQMSLSSCFLQKRVLLIIRHSI